MQEQQQYNKDSETQDDNNREVRKISVKNIITRARIFNFIRIAIVSLVMIVVFFTGDYSILKACRKSQATEQLRKEKADYQLKIQQTYDEIEQFKNDKKHIERLAREKYHMRKENEDVFIIEE